MSATQLKAPITARLADVDAERVRRSHDEKIRELQKLVGDAVSGAFFGRQIFTASSIYTPSSGTMRVRVRMVAGGGGGGGCASGTGGGMGAAGGSSGTYFEITISSSGPLIRGGAITVGAAGAAGAAAAGTGGTGGDSSIVVGAITYTAKGGAGGLGGTGGGLSVANTQSPASGTSTGDYSTFGPGHPGLFFTGSTWLAGAGGCSPFGGGGAAQVGVAAVGLAASGYGGGGGGGAATAASKAGGAGGAGLVIVDEWGG